MAIATTLNIGLYYDLSDDWNRIDRSSKLTIVWLWIAPNIRSIAFVRVLAGVNFS